jgi:hypothetical protein
LTWYQQQDSDDEYTSDMRISHRDRTLFVLEVTFSQCWNVLKRKIDRMLADEEILAVLVIRIAETSGWSPPSRAATLEDFISSVAWIERTRTIDGYSGISVDGLEWAKKVTCNLYFFPGDWCVEDGDPPVVSYSILPLVAFSYSAAVPFERGSYRTKRLPDQDLVLHRARHREAS